MSLIEQLLQGPGAQDRFAQLQSLKGQGPGTAPEANSLADFTSGGDNPWGIDPNGMDLLTRHGVTLDADAIASLRAARQATGLPVWSFIGGGYRSPEASAALHDQRYTNGHLNPGMLPAADAGQSMHNYGLAFDQSRTLPMLLQRYLEQHGWFNGASFGDPPHWSYGRRG